MVLSKAEKSSRHRQREKERLTELIRARDDLEAMRQRFDSEVEKRLNDMDSIHLVDVFKGMSRANQAAFLNYVLSDLNDRQSNDVAFYLFPGTDAGRLAPDDDHRVVLTALQARLDGQDIAILGMFQKEPPFFRDFDGLEVRARLPPGVNARTHHAAAAAWLLENCSEMDKGWTAFGLRFKIRDQLIATKFKLLFG